MLKKLVRVFGNENEKNLKRYRKTVKLINALEVEMKLLADQDFPKRTEQLRKRLNGGETLDDLIPESFALYFLSIKRTPPYLPSVDRKRKSCSIQCKGLYG